MEAGAGADVEAGATGWSSSGSGSGAVEAVAEVQPSMAAEEAGERSVGTLRVLLEAGAAEGQVELLGRQLAQVLLQPACGILRASPGPPARVSPGVSLRSPRASGGLIFAKCSEFDVF